MIAYLTGKIKLKSDNFLIIENQGIGYKVFVSEKTLSKLKQGEGIEMFTHQHVREDDIQLFGFLNFEELNLFEKLISVSGIGPKTALSVFAIASAQDIVSAIINGDPTILKKVSGIGAKTAERIILELKSKIKGLAGIEGVKTSKELSADTEAIEALVALGYSSSQAWEALKQVDPSVKNSEDKVKAALKILH